ncbi:MAG: hypothetical protein HY860_00720 [Chlamydiales bacterium]|nr:hypothetical protein [Chlamydiales bacterium]
MKRSQHNYQLLLQQVNSFINYTKQAINGFIAERYNINEDTINSIAASIYGIEEQTSNLSYYMEDEEKIEMQLLQNIIHAPVYSFNTTSIKGISIFQAAKSFHDSKDISELQDILQSCAKDPESFHTLCNNLSDISKQLAIYIRKEKTRKPQSI